ncbi:MAG: hypothetical protein LBC48_05375 [Dysgonamonadaceae bacterium]|jgi:hypothetical protein|nr:hypothetical protein [Dysgonamonadaceae bacterium]
MKRILFYFCLSLTLLSCGNGNKEKSSPDGKTTPQEKQLNISILLDLSDRINPQKHPASPEHYERDAEIVKTVTEYFKKNMKNLTAWKAKGKIRIFFSPAPANPAINKIAEKLNIDCSKMDNKERKIVYDTITELFIQNLTEIYKQSIQTSNWEGSDIWRFFRNDVKDYCIDKDSTYRNILIILTDGYIYHKESVYKNGNQYSYLLENNIKKFRTMDWKDKIDKDDFGIITENHNLNNLEILVLGINAENNNNKIDEDILKYVIEKWCKEMNVSKYKTYSTDLPANTKIRIDNFLND